jgi:uncharacterized protein (DUF2062 family)
MLDRLRRLMPSQEAVRSNRWLRWLGPLLHHPRLWHMSRRGIALGSGIGVFFAFLIPIAQIPLSAAVAMALRANVPSAIAATLVNTPLTFPAVYYAAWKVGSLVLGEETAGSRPPPVPGVTREVGDADIADPRGWWRRFVDGMHAVGKPLILGSVIFAVGFGLLAYLAVNGVWHLRVRMKRRRRLRRAGDA